MQIVAKTGRPAWCGSDRALSEAFARYWASDCSAEDEAFNAIIRVAEVGHENEQAAANADGVMEVVR